MNYFVEIVADLNEIPARCAQFRYKHHYWSSLPLDRRQSSRCSDALRKGHKVAVFRKDGDAILSKSNTRAGGTRSRTLVRRFSQKPGQSRKSKPITSIIAELPTFSSAPRTRHHDIGSDDFRGQVERRCGRGGRRRIGPTAAVDPGQSVSERDISLDGQLVPVPTCNY